MNPSLRIDRWLWFARFFKSRSLAARICAERRVRVNGTVITKSNQQVKTDDVLTFPQGKEIRIVKVLELGTRRGPAAEAQALFEDLSPRPEQKDANELQEVNLVLRDRGAGRPTKADRREIMRFVGKD